MHAHGDADAEKQPEVLAARTHSTECATSAGSGLAATCSETEALSSYLFPCRKKCDFQPSGVLPTHGRCPFLKAPPILLSFARFSMLLEPWLG